MSYKTLLRHFVGNGFQAPSYDAIWWIFVRTTPAAFNKMLSSWWERLPGELQTKMFAIDGKRITGAGTGKTDVLLVQLFAAEGSLMIAQGGSNIKQ